MKLLGFNYTKISVEKSPKPVKELKLGTKINIANVEQVKSKLFSWYSPININMTAHANRKNRI